MLTVYTVVVVGMCAGMAGNNALLVPVVFGLLLSPGVQCVGVDSLAT